MPHITLEAARVNAGLTQQMLAEKLNVTKNTIANWEKGISEPSATQFRAISEISGIPMDCLFLPEQSHI